MKNLTRIFILILLWPAANLYSQQLSPSVISSSGGFYSGDGGMLSFTAGELSAIETYAGDASILTQGFQQPWDLGTYIAERPFEDFAFGVYPNPSNGQFYLLTESDLSLAMSVTISDLFGQPVKQLHADQVSKINITSIDITTVPAGTYILHLQVKENNISLENTFNYKITIVK